MTGRTVSHYEILERLGSGGMGEIYRARDTRLNRMVAIKVLPRSDSGDETPRLRFMQEARAASGLSHPNIVTVHDILADDGADLLVMELVIGRTLAQVLSGTGMPIPQVLSHAVQIARALAAAHAAGIVHRDVKPGNIMVTSSGLVKVLDFGLAKPTYTGMADDSTRTASISGPLTVRGTVVGTVNYMSPEQAEGKQVDGRSDIFSFGILLYEMVTGHRAFPGNSAIATMTAILRDDVRPIREFAPAAPPRLIEAIDKCLRKNRDERWRTMDELLGALESLKLRYDTGSAATAQVPAAPKKSGRLLVVAIAIGCLVVLAEGVFWVVARHRPPPPPPPPPAVVAQAPAQQAVVPAAVPAPPTDAGAAPPAPTAPAALLTNDSIVQMLEAKVPIAVIVGQVRSSKTQFDFSTAAVIRLSQAGAPESLIQAMREASKPAGTKQAAAAPAPAKAPDTAPAPADSAASTPPDVAPDTVPAPADSAASTPPAPPVAPRPERATKPVAVADGAPVTVELAADIPANARAGTPLEFTVVSDVVSGGKVAISKGARAAGQVATETKKKVLILETKMTIQVDQVDAAGGQKLKLRATSASSGSAPSRRAVDTGTYTGAKKSKDIAAAAGTRYVVYIDGGQSVTVPK
jgi:serine/threonine-protein kinase